MSQTNKKTEMLSKNNNTISEIQNYCLQIARKKLKIHAPEIKIKSVTNSDLKNIGGIGGYCANKKKIQISIDKRFIGSKQNFAENLKHTLLHELQHAARLQNGLSFKHVTVFE